ncbi:acyltransferase [Streptomyces sp. MRC013]|uniref:acyltransferase family protein n=1 Tax=Streptomyces sp. MRC013 TaxID=2898276 RepID=UPI00202604D1|nr:acyltransferase [Streptomyces sp. MRC013]URM88837.1 acyltransferase [Streptomyces sp. MRC013]
MTPLLGPVRAPAVRRPPRLAALDGLRLLAALMVLLFHYVGLGHGWRAPARTLFPEVFPFAAYGWLGVQLFFLVSGFVICMSCWDRSLGDFFTSRVVRLYPAYWFCVLATTAVLVLVPGGYVRRPWHEVLANLTMVQAFLGVEPVDPVYWTLFAELRFYLLFAIVAWGGLTYRRVLLFCCLWGTAALVLDRFGGESFGQFLMPEHCWYFIAGIAFHLMYRFRPTALLWGVVLMSFTAAVPTARATWRASVGNMGQWVPFWPVMAVLAVSFAAMALIATGRTDRITWRWLPVAGSLTYPLYLLHQYVGWELITHVEGNFRIHPAVLLGAVAGGMAAAALLVHRCVEEPLGRWLRPRVRAGVEDASSRAGRLRPQAADLRDAGTGRAPGPPPAGPGAAVPGPRREAAVARAPGSDRGGPVCTSGCGRPVPSRAGAGEPG